MKYRLFTRGHIRRAGEFSVAFFFALQIFVAGAALCAEKPRQVACPGCNVILVLVDALRADALGAYGYPRGTSPNLDRLAATGNVFLNAWAQAPNTLPSHMSIFTGQYPWTHKVEAILRDRLAPDAVTLPMALQLRGYRTVWRAPVNQPHLGLAAGFERGFDVFLNPIPRRKMWRDRDRLKEWEGAFDWLESNKDARFFMFLYSSNVHDPYTQTKAALDRFPEAAVPSKAMSPQEAGAWITKNIATDPSLAPFKEELEENIEIFGVSDFQEKRDKLRKLISMSPGAKGKDPGWLIFRILYKLFADFPEDIAAFRAAYDAGVFEADALVGKLSEKLQTLGLADNTLLVITSDHGEEFMEHGGLRHSQIYVETLQVPLIVVLPGGGKGKRFGQLVQSIDIAPTILDAVGFAPLPAAQGLSLMPLISGLAFPNPAALAFARWNGQYSVRDSRYTYLLRKKCAGGFSSWNAACVQQEFYDRAADSGELNDIFPANKEAAAGFAAHLSEKIKSTDKGPVFNWPLGVTEETRKRILDTGYW